MLTLIIGGIIVIGIAAFMFGNAYADEDEVLGFISILPAILGIFLIAAGICVGIQGQKSPMIDCVESNVTQSKQISIDGKVEYYEVTFKDIDGKTWVITFPNNKDNK